MFNVLSTICVSLLSLCFAAVFDAQKAFMKMHNVQTESAFVSSQTPTVSMAMADQSVFDLMSELHKSFSDGTASFKKRKTGDLPESIQSGFTQVLIPANKAIPRFNFKVRTDIVKHLLENKSQLGRLYKNWSGIKNYVQFRMARELVWQHVMQSFGYECVLNEFDYVLSKPPKVPEGQP